MPNEEKLISTGNVVEKCVAAGDTIIYTYTHQVALLAFYNFTSKSCNSVPGQITMNWDHSACCVKSLNSISLVSREEKRMQSSVSITTRHLRVHKLSITVKADLRAGDYASEICDVVWNAEELKRWLNGQHHWHWIVSVNQQQQTHIVPAAVLFSLLTARLDDCKNMARRNLHPIEMQLQSILLLYVQSREVYITYYLEK